MGRELGYSGADLQMFIKEEKAEINEKEKEERERGKEKREREEKEQEREERRLRREAEEQERSASIGKDQCRYRDRARDQTQIKRFITRIPIKST